MSRNSFKALASALSDSPDWASISHAWSESEDLLRALKGHVSAALAAQVTQIRRGDPARGIRGSQLTVVARNAAAAAKLRLALADWPQVLRSSGWGVQEVKVAAERSLNISAPPKAAVQRDPIPAKAKRDFLALADEMPSEALRAALSRLANRG